MRAGGGSSEGPGPSHWIGEAWTAVLVLVLVSPQALLHWGGGGGPSGVGAQLARPAVHLQMMAHWNRRFSEK